MESTNQKRSSRRGFLSIKKWDFLGSEFQLKYSDSDRFQTTYGGCLSLFVIIMVTLASIVTVRNLFSTTSPSVYVSSTTSDKVPKIDLYENDIFMAFSAILNGGTATENPKTLAKYLTIKGFVETFEADFQQGTEYKLVNLAEINYVPCSELQDKRPLKSLIDNNISETVILSSFVCPELQNLTDKYFVESRFQDPPNYFFNIYIYPCSLPDQSQCASEAELNKFNLVFSSVENTIDVSNKHHPLKFNVEFDGYYVMNFEQEKHILNKLKYGEIRDDYWDFFGDRLNTRYVFAETGVLDTEKRDPTIRYCDVRLMREKDFIGCPPLMRIRFIATPVTKITTRSYNKVFSSLGEIGGTAEILTLLTAVIYLWYNNHHLKKYIQEKMISSRRQERLANILFTEDGEELDLLVEKDSNERMDHNLDLEADRKGKRLVKSKSNKIDSDGDKMKKLQMLLDKNIDENEDGMFLFRSLNTIRALEGMMLESHHKALLPVALMNITKKQTEEQEQEKREEEVASQKGVEKSKISQKGVLEPGDNHKAKEMDLDEAFRRLQTIKPKNQLQEMMNEFIRLNLPQYFKNSALINTSSQEAEQRSSKIQSQNICNSNKNEQDKHQIVSSPNEKILERNQEDLSKRAKFSKSRLFGNQRRHKRWFTQVNKVRRGSQTLQSRIGPSTKMIAVKSKQSRRSNNLAQEPQNN